MAPSLPLLTDGRQLGSVVDRRSATSHGDGDVGDRAGRGTGSTDAAHGGAAGGTGGRPSAPAAAGRVATDGAGRRRGARVLRAAGRPAAARDRPPAVPPRRPELSLEDLLGGRVLAWAGGLSLLAGLLFLLVVAISRGWIGEEARTALAAAMSLGLLVAGIRAYERRGHTDSALAATATGIAGLFASAVVAVQAYELIPAAAGLAVAFAVGATATWLALRWEARGIAALGILGAVSAPVLVGGELSARGDRVPVPGHRLGGRRPAVAALDVAGVRELRARDAAVGRVAVHRGAARAARAGGADRLRRARGRRGGRLRAAHPQRRAQRRLAPAADAQRARARVGGLGCAAGRRRARLARRRSRSPTSRSPRPATGSPGCRTRSCSARPGSASCSPTSRSPRSSTACRSWPAGRAARSRWPRSPAPRSARSTASSRSPGSAATWPRARAHARLRGAAEQRRGRARPRRRRRARARRGRLLRLRAHRPRRARPARAHRARRHRARPRRLPRRGHARGPALTLAWAAEAVALAELARRHRDPLARAGSLAFLGCAAVHALAILAPASALVVGLEDPARGAGAARRRRRGAGRRAHARRRPARAAGDRRGRRALPRLGRARHRVPARPAVRQQGQALLSGCGRSPASPRWSPACCATAASCGSARSRCWRSRSPRSASTTSRRSTRCTAWRRSSPSACCCCSARSPGSGCGPPPTLSR